MKAGQFLLSGVAIAMLAGCASSSQSDEPLWRDPPPVSSAARVSLKSRVVAPVEQQKPAVLAVIDDQPATPIPVSLFIVNADERSVMPLLRRWARASKVDFTWSSSVDYVLTERMRTIEATSLDSAVEEMRKALNGVSTPLSISFDGKSLAVTPVQSADLPPLTVPVPVAAAAPASAVVVARPVAAAPAPAPAVVVARPVAAAPAPAPAAVVARPVAAAPAPAPAAVVARPVAAAPAPAPATVGAQPVAAASIDGPASWDAAARAAAGVLPMSWNVGNSRSLREVVEAWGKAAGVRVVWEASADYPVTDEIRSGKYAGTFKEALMQLAASFGQLPAPVGMSFIEQGRGVKVFNIRPT